MHNWNTARVGTRARSSLELIETQVGFLSQWFNFLILQPEIAMSTRNCLQGCGLKLGHNVINIGDIDKANIYIDYDTGTTTSCLGTY